MVLLVVSPFTAIMAQTVTWDEFADIYFPETEESDDGVSLYDELLEMHRNPVNINTAQRTDLLRMPFLDEAQADSIISLVRRSHGLYSLGELHFVRNLYHKEIAYMPLFFFCSRTESHMTTNGKNGNGGSNNMPPEKILTEISTAMDFPLYQREGFKEHSKDVLDKNPNKQYLGNNVSTTLRYRSSYGNKIFWGLTAQKDEGEPFCSKDNILYDSYSFYISGKTNGIVRQWIAGDYRTNFGLGLTVGASRPDAMNILSSFNPRQQGFTKHTSTDEAFFMRGGAVTVKTAKLTLHAFASWRKLDATLSKDSISTIVTNGYHRTPLEMSKRGNIQSLQGGLSAIVDFAPLTVGLQFTHTHYDTPFRTPSALYRKYYFKGKDFGNYSIYYAFTEKGLRFWGETATSLQGGVASQHRLQYAPSYNLKLILLHRYYATRYLSTSAQSYRAGSRIQNEHGILAGANVRLNQFWQLLVYGDYAHYPFAIYQTDYPSDAVAATTQLEYSPSKNTALLVRYKFRHRPQDNKQNRLDHKQQHSFKMQTRYAIGRFIKMTTAADMTFLSQPDKANSCGWMLSHKATATPSSDTRINIAGAFFHTDSYSEALYFNEPNLLYYSYSPSCYYHGQRASLSLIHKIGIVSLAVKYGITHYTNRSTVGSGLRAYNGSTLQNVTIQGTVKF